MCLKARLFVSHAISHSAASVHAIALVYVHGSAKSSAFATLMHLFACLCFPYEVTKKCGSLSRMGVRVVHLGCELVEEVASSWTDESVIGVSGVRGEMGGVVGEGVMMSGKSGVGEICGVEV